MVIFYNRWEQYNEIQLKQNGREQSKNYKSSTLPCVSRGRVPSRQRLGWMDGVKTALGRATTRER